MSPFDISGPSILGKELMRGHTAPKNPSPPITFNNARVLALHVSRPAEARNRTTKLDHAPRPARNSTTTIRSVSYSQDIPKDVVRLSEQYEKAKDVCVGQILPSESEFMQQLNVRIDACVVSLEAAITKYELGGYCFADLASVDCCRARMDALIAERDGLTLKGGAA